MLTTLLDIAGMALIVAAAFVAGGPALALFVAGVCLLVTSWRLVER
jgi:hypothetical protein